IGEMEITPPLIVRFLGKPANCGASYSAHLGGRSLWAALDRPPRPGRAPTPPPRRHAPGAEVRPTRPPQTRIRASVPPAPPGARARGRLPPRRDDAVQPRRPPEVRKALRGQHRCAEHRALRGTG